MFQMKMKYSDDRLFECIPSRSRTFENKPTTLIGNNHLILLLHNLYIENVNSKQVLDVTCTHTVPG